MMRFIKRTKYVYAMCAKPVIYARLIKSFWRTTEVVTGEDGVIVVRGNITKNLQLTVSEQAIRTALRIDEDEIGANDELTVAECETCFVNMGHPPVFPKSQFFRARLGKKWKLLCYVVQQCLSRRSAGFDNFPSDIASPIVAIAENKPFNMSKWIMNGFVFNLVKGKRFKFLMYPRFLQLMINVAYPIIRTEGYAGGILYTEDMNDLSYRKMSIGNVPSVELFDYMRDIANNEEDIEGVYHHISNGEIVNPQDLVDEVPDNMLDDDEYFARHPEEEDGSDNEEEEDNDSDDSDDDDGNDDVESVSEEAENVEDDELVGFETENVEVIEPVVTEEPVEVVSAAKEMVVEVPKAITVQYVRSRRSKPVIEPMLVEEPVVIEDVNVSEQMVDIVQIAKEVEAEVEFVAQTDDETDAGVSVSVPVNIPTTSSPAAENIEQSLESSPKIVSSVNVNEDKERIAELEEMVAKLMDINEQLKASNDRKKKRLEEFWATHNQNLKTFKELDADHLMLKDEHEKLKVEYKKLKDEHENLKYDYKELKAECNTLDAEKEMLEKWLEETRSKKSGSTSDKDFSDEVIEVTEDTQEGKVYYTRARAEGKRKLDAVPEITEEASVSKKAKTDETVQIEPIQSVDVAETEVVEMAKIDETVKETEETNVPETMTEEASQFEPVQTDTAPMIEALDDLDDIDFTESEPEVEPEHNPDDEIPPDLPERFAYLERM
ncbi:hypothetical protein QVD17_28682 [Tagetes erecta]|uniref:Uncharacterized protein n=1 Tax=Tagetes erecta TaxID=13708 RepID=A0AAD8KAV5_TARER|nr:hypothetical protein QVD17_28682 [Tagetes erecta]